MSDNDYFWSRTRRIGYLEDSTRRLNFDGHKYKKMTVGMALSLGSAIWRDICSAASFGVIKTRIARRSMYHSE